MTIIRMTLVACMALGLTACGGAAAYQSLDPALPGAEMRFHKTYNGTGILSAANQFYSLSTDQFCDTARNAASFTWTTGDVTLLRVPPGQSIMVWSLTMYHQTTSVSIIGGNAAPNVSTELCRSVGRFTPTEGHAYDVRQVTSLNAADCSLTITDLHTGAVAPEFELIDIDECRQRES